MALIQKNVEHDQVVYQLYGLTDEEITVVEGAAADADKPAVAILK